MQSRAPVSVSARANFEEERAVDAVALGAVDGGEVLGHVGLATRVTERGRNE